MNPLWWVGVAFAVVFTIAMMTLGFYRTIWPGLREFGVEVLG